MITIEEIADRLTDKKDFNFSVNKEFWEPTRAENYILPIFSVAESKAKGADAKLRAKLGKVLAFIDSVKRKRFKSGCTIMPISTTNKDNLAIWDSEMNVSRAIKYMIQIGLISIESNNYQFGAWLEKDNKSKVYRYYKENEDKIKEYCKNKGIDMYIVQNKIYSLNDMKNVNKYINISKVRFDSRMKLIRPEGVSKAEFEKQLTLCLYKNYPALRVHIELANEINDLFYKNYHEFKVRFSPNFTWSDDGLYVSKIGIRATNSISNIKKEDRHKVIEAYGFTLEKDINASVPRMTLSLNSGHWIDESIDIYKLIYHVMEPESECNNETREAIKKLHMRAYFDSGDKSTGHHTWISMNQENIEKDDVCDKMIQLREAIIKAEGGKLYGSDIYYVESCVYMMTLFELLESGHFVWQVYDCFYSTGNEDAETFENIVANSIKKNFNYFIKTYWK